MACTAEPVTIHHDATLATAPVHSSPGTVRVLAWNIRHGLGRDADTAGAHVAHLAELGRAIAVWHPDVVILNEVEFDGLLSGGLEQSAVIARAAALPWRALQRDVDLRLMLTTIEHGNVVLSRYPLRDARRLELPADRPMIAWWIGHRRALEVIVEHPEGAFRVIALHLSHRSRSTRMAAAEELRARVAHEALPMIVAGDFNATWPPGLVDESDGLGHLLAAGPLHGPLSPTARPHTLDFESTLPTGLVDWILASPHWSFVSYHVADGALSDHPPVIATLRRAAAPSRMLRQ